MRKPFHLTVKPSGASCNLACDYCYYLSKKQLYRHHPFTLMSTQVLREFTRQYIESQNGREIVFAWQGGEPTMMGIDFFRQAFSFQEEFKRPGQFVINTIQTNGMLLDDDWCSFLRDKNFLVGLSMDGPPEIHNVFRRTVNKAPTFVRVYDSLQLLKRYEVEFNILCVVSHANAEKPQEVYKFFIEEGIHFIQFIPTVVHSTIRKNVFGISGMEWGSFLCGVFNQWVNRDVGRIFIMNFEAMLAAWCGVEQSTCVHKPNCGQTLVLEHNGDVYSCDFFVDSEHRLGNIMLTDLSSLASLPCQIAFGNQKSETLPEICLSCPALLTCNGGCLADRIPRTGNNKAWKNHFCDGHKLFFSHVAPYFYLFQSQETI
jgi:uncharacterized protein